VPAVFTGVLGMLGARRRSMLAVLLRERALGKDDTEEQENDRCDVKESLHGATSRPRTREAI
jgi:hypothetical protein